MRLSNQNQVEIRPGTPISGPKALIARPLPRLTSQLDSKCGRSPTRSYSMYQRQRCLWVPVAAAPADNGRSGDGVSALSADLRPVPENLCRVSSKLDHESPSNQPGSGGGDGGQSELHIKSNLHANCEAILSPLFLRTAEGINQATLQRTISDEIVMRRTPGGPPPPGQV